MTAQHRAARMRDRDAVDLLQWALPRLRLSWTGFRRPRRQVRRRLARRLAELGLADIAAYRRRLETEPAEWSVLDSLCRVTISRFFRDREMWQRLGQEALPDLARRAASERRPLRAWSAGCASGEEPWSLVILWELGVAPRVPGADLEVAASDADAHLLERARRAVYPAASAREVPDTWRRLAFVDRDGELELTPELRQKVDFLEQDVRADAPSGRFDLVFCRNLAFTYFQRDLQLEMLKRLAERTSTDGRLVIGGHESLPATSGWREEGRSIYRRLG